MSHSKFRAALAALLATLPLLVTCPVARADGRDYTVVGRDGVALAVQEDGDANGSPIVFVHGLLGSRLNWAEQVKDPQLRRHRLITFDLRGHGLSAKPVEATAYSDGRRWADDLAAVIDATHAKKPVLVGWSLGGAVISNYLATYGDENVAGAMYVDAVIELKSDQIVAHPEVYRDMIASDLRTHLDGERTFLRLCFERQPDAATFERLLANAALASWDMQRAVQSMTVAAEQGLGKAHIPLLLLYGARDALVKAEPSIARAMGLNPRIQSRVYGASGHAPFLEEASRFNRDLLAFVRSVEPR